MAGSGTGTPISGTTRTTSAAVGGIIEVDSSISLTPFIEAAAALVTKHCESLNSAYTSDELEMIERFLTAHLYTLRDPRPTQEAAGKVSAWYQSKVALGLSTSHYGQMAMRLDWYGGLAALDNMMLKGGKRTVGVTWLGTESETLEE